MIENIITNNINKQAQNTNSIDVAYLSNMYTSKKINSIFQSYLLLIKGVTDAIDDNLAVEDFLMATHGELQ